MKDITFVLKEETLLAKGLKDFTICKVGNRENTRFWLDPWADMQPLHLKFPRIFAMNTNKNALISEVGLFVRGKWSWDLHFRRQFFGWEEQIYESFLQVIDTVYPSSNEVDSLIWCLNPNGYFSVKLLCLWTEESVHDEAEYQIFENMRKMVSPKACLLLWQACQNKLATKLNLIRRGILAPDVSQCVLCNLMVVSNDHLFLLCPKVRGLWNAVLNREKISWSSPFSLEQFAIKWPERRVKSDARLWEAIPFAMVWSIWTARNEVIFCDKVFNPQQVWDMHMLKLAWWYKGSWPNCSYDQFQFFNNFCDSRVPAIQIKHRLVFWSPPSIGLLKFNVDGSSKGNPGHCGIGGILRDSNEKVLGFFSLNAGQGKAFEAETKAILNALIFCQEFLFKNIIIESDSTTAVGWANSKDHGGFSTS